MPDRPRVDVAVVTWNAGADTARSLRELLDSDQGCEIRLLVRDNASSDDTVEQLRALVPEAELDAGTDNLGFAGGVNTVLRRSDAPFVLLLNPDASPLPGAIGALVDAALARPRAAAVAARLENPDGTLQHSTHPFPSPLVAALVGFRWDRLPRERAEELMLEGAWAHDRARPIDWAHMAALLLRREAIDDVGVLDERFFMYAEDLEWCWRAHRRGWEIWFEPSAVVRHEGNVSGRLRYGATREKIHLGNAFRFLRRERGMPVALAWWGLSITGAGAKTVTALRRGNRAAARRHRAQAAALLAAPWSDPRGGRDVSRSDD